MPIRKHTCSPPPRPHIRTVRIKAGFDPNEASRIVGKGLTLWVLFTSGLNWIMYKRINKK